MAVPPTPGSLLASSRRLAAWGARIDSDARSPVDKLAELIASRFDVTLAVSLEELGALAAEHRYVIVECLGATRHSAVYAAVDALLARYVAIKIHRADGDDADELVLAEARAASQLNHPNVVRIYDVGEHDGWLFSVSELCDEDLSAWCQRHGWLEILARIIEAGEGLARLHAAGVIHGDVKPANILILNGVARLADFGMASVPGHSTRIVGTPGFIAPEVAAGLRTRSGDVFALAATAWACLFAELPYGPLPSTGELAEVIELTVNRARSRAFAQPRRQHPTMPQLVVDELECGLRWDPGHRPSLELWLGRLEVLHAWGTRRARLRARMPWARGWSSRRALAFVGALFVTFGGVTAYLAARAEPARTGGGASLGFEDLLGELASSNPRLRAEVAARVGDGAAAVDALGDAWEQFETLSSRDQVRLANSASEIARRLELAEQLEHAQLAWSVAILLHGRVGQLGERDDALRSFQEVSDVIPITPALRQNR
ncbi:serine/threonine-protein kinase [Enhygromyxa salina]|uniref:Serine/threonine-protein kinase PrkC n=1 Tax=Enhygromyxa salina TaxID=215803 RepID=A0A2S9Y2L2_9BACT|nr:serine/threonine-protein kinase [Enhygromyxa salina]PRP99353.1 Serine/threonine-protein kinase PrkC [Enhygromyxa salina]